MKKTATETINKLRISNQIMPTIGGLIRPDALQPYYHECSGNIRRAAYNEYKAKIAWLEKEYAHGTNKSEIIKQCRKDCYALAKQLGEELNY